MKEEDTPFDFDRPVKCTRESDKAILVQFDGGESWVPKSQIHDNSEVYGVGHQGKLIVSGWFAEQKGWDGSKPKEEPTTRQIQQCRSCGEPIRWGKTPAGKNVPINVKPTVIDGGGEIYESHFKTCVNADQHIKRSRA